MINRNTPIKDSDRVTETEYERWLERASAGSVCDPDVVKELQEMKGDKRKIKEAFNRNLVFGTGGLRGIMGAGTNRLNVHTVAKASQGVADYIRKSSRNDGSHGSHKIAVSYDSRHKSSLFARIACQVFAANGIGVYLYPQLMPTPCLSFAVRYLGCDAGVMVTASHNPSEYNGYKVYGRDGCQITTEAADAIYKEIEKLDLFDDIRITEFEDGFESGEIRYISQDVWTAFTEAVKAQSVLGDRKIDKRIPIVYSPLNGTGLKPVLRVLEESGYTNITVVREQQEPDGDFPTCPYPNPEMEEAMALGLEYAERNQADLMLATDPDCDRVGIGVRDSRGTYQLLSGNETGLLLLDYVCSQRLEGGTMPKTPVMAKTIVTTDMGERIADHYGVRTVNVLTGFKYIGEQIGILEEQGRVDDFIFGFEESYGYLTGSYVRDKDGVGAALLICEMCAWYKAQGKNLADRLEELYKTYGFCINSLRTYGFEGADGFEKMEQLMDDFRTKPVSFGGIKAVKILDYKPGIYGLPRSNVLKFVLENGCSVVVRPSGTEPKLKVYLSVCAGGREEAKELETRIGAGMQNMIVG